MTWINLQELIPKIANKYSFGRTLKALEIIHEYRSLAPRFLPEEALKNSTAHSYKDHLLTVHAGDSSTAQTIQIHKHQLLEEINKKYGAQIIREIRILIR